MRTAGNPAVPAGIPAYTGVSATRRGLAAVGGTATRTAQAGVEREHARLLEQTRQLSALLEVSRSLSATLELRPLLGLVLDQLRTVVDYTSAAAFAYEEGGETAEI